MLISNIPGLIPSPVPSFFKDFTNVFVTASGMSYYSQCLPYSTIDLGFCASAMHWLQKKPCNITNGVHHTQITIESERQMFVEQGAKDWELILLQRAKEMKHGMFLDGICHGNSERYEQTTFLNVSLMLFC